MRRIWSHPFKRWRKCGWQVLAECGLYGEYGLVNLISLIPSIHLSGARLRGSCMRENRTYSLGRGRWPARKRATSDPRPMNQPNNAYIPAAEAGEERKRITENTSPSHTLSTQREVGLSDGLRSVQGTGSESGSPLCSTI